MTMIFYFKNSILNMKQQQFIKEKYYWYVQECVFVDKKTLYWQNEKDFLFERNLPIDIRNKIDTLPDKFIKKMPF